MQIVAVGVIGQENELVYGCANCDHEEVKMEARRPEFPCNECDGAEKLVKSEPWTRANGKPPGTPGLWIKRSFKCEHERASVWVS